MPFQLGNKDAEKWNKESTLLFLDNVISIIESNRSTIHLGKVIVEAGHYPELWTYLTNKFKDDQDVFQSIKKAETLLEARIVENTMNGHIKSTPMAIFYLKNKHGYEDKSTVDQNVILGDGVKIEYID